MDVSKSLLTREEGVEVVLSSLKEFIWNEMRFLPNTQYVQKVYTALFAINLLDQETIKAIAPDLFNFSCGADSDKVWFENQLKKAIGDDKYFQELWDEFYKVENEDSSD